jgi:Amt family ammonium transporter
MSSAASGEMAAHVAMNTTLSAACGGIVSFMITYIITHSYDVGSLCNGILAGLVSITAPCGNVESGSAVAIGILGAFVYVGASMLLKKLKIDDPVDASPVHGACGIWGTIAAGLFDMGNGFDTFHGWSGFSCMTETLDDGTVVCQEGIWGKAFGVQILLVIMVVLWAGTLSTLIFLGLKLTGFLRISEEVEELGLDAAKHSPTKAYQISPEPSSTAAK